MPPPPTTPKLNILCIHGSRQTGQLFRDRISRLTSQLKFCAHLTFVDGPAELPIARGDSAALRAWWLDDGGVADALNAIEIHWKQGRYDGVLGFSQGALCAASVAARPLRFPGCRFVILASAPSEPRLDAPAWGDAAAKLPIDIPSFHMLSQQDKAVLPAESIRIQACFASARAVTYEHSKGHALPCRAADVEAIAAFLAAQQSVVAMPQPPPRPPGLRQQPSKPKPTMQAAQPPGLLQPPGFHQPPGLHQPPGPHQPPAKSNATPPQSTPPSKPHAAPPSPPPAAPPPPPPPAPPAAPMPSLTPADTATQLTAWSDELLALEAIYPDLLTHDDGCADAAAIAEAAAAADAFTADSSSDGAPACVEVSFTVLLDGGGVIDVSDSAMPPGEVRLQIGLRPGYPHKGVLPKIALVHEMLTDVRLLSGSNLSQRTRSRRHARARVAYACSHTRALIVPRASGFSCRWRGGRGACSNGGGNGGARKHMRGRAVNVLLPGARSPMSSHPFTLAHLRYALVDVLQPGAHRGKCGPSGRRMARRRRWRQRWRFRTSSGCGGGGYGRRGAGGCHGRFSSYRRGRGSDGGDGADYGCGGAPLHCSSLVGPIARPLR